MPRPGPAMEPAVVRLPKPTIVALERLAATLGVKPSELHRRLVTEGLAAMARDER